MKVKLTRFESHFKIFSREHAIKSSFERCSFYWIETTNENNESGMTSRYRYSSRFLVNGKSDRTNLGNAALIESNLRSESNFLPFRRPIASSHTRGEELLISSLLRSTLRSNTNKIVQVRNSLRFLKPSVRTRPSKNLNREPHKEL